MSHPPPEFSAFHRAAAAAVFGHRRLILGVFAIATLAMVFLALQLRVDAGFKKQIPLGHEYMQTFLDYEAEFGGANRVLVAVMARDGNMFTLPFMQVMEKVTNEVIAIPAVDDARVRSIFTPNVRFVEIVEDGFAGGNVIPARFAPNAPGFVATPDDFETIRANIVKAGIVGRLVARDFSGAMVMAELVPEGAGREKLDYQEVARALEDIRGRYENEDIQIHIIGFAKIVGDIADGARSVVAFFGVAMAITFVLLWIYAGHALLALIGVAVAIVAVIWQLGGLKLLGFGIDPMNILTPFLVFAIGVSHGVQMINGWLNERMFSGVEGDERTLRAAPQSSPLQAAERTFLKLLTPGAIALVSDAVGFLTILFIEIRIIQELAITAALGVAVIILTNLLLLPLVLSFVRFRDPEAMREKRIRRAVRSEGAWHLLAVFARPVPALLAIGGGVALALWAWQVGKGLQIGDSQEGVPELRPESRFNQDARAIARAFGLGIDIINVIAETAPQACTESYKAMETIDRFAWHIQNVEGVQQVISLPQIAKVIHAGWNEGNIRWRVLPRDNYVMRQALQNIETDTGLLNAGCSAMPVQIFLTDHKAETIARVVEAVKRFREANDAYDVGFRIALKQLEEQAQAEGRTVATDATSLRLATGNAGVMAATNEVVAAAQMPMLAWVYGAVFVLCLITFRSLLATVCIILPLALVSLLANALMTLLGIGLKVNTLPVAALGVGIGVDYAIYIYSRMEEYLKSGHSLYESYYHALRLTGTAVIFTALTLAVGVGTWFFSELQFQADMGILLAFFFLTNMVGAVILLPALMRWLGFLKWARS
jgi:predicted RND superfamily exporter protein